MSARDGATGPTGDEAYTDGTGTFHPAERRIERGRGDRGRAQSSASTPA